MKLKKRSILILAGLIAGGVGLNWLLNHFDVVGGILRFLWGLVFPFVLGYVLAFLLNLPMSALERLVNKHHPGRLKRPLSFFLTLLLVLGALAVVLLLIIPQLWQTVLTLTANMPGYVANAQKALQPYFDYIPILQNWVQNLNVDWQSIAGNLTAWLSAGAGSFFSSAIDVATSILGGFFSFFVGIILAAYLLLDKEHLCAQLQGLLQAYLPKKKYEKLAALGRTTYKTYARFVSGQCLEALIVGVLYLVVLLIGRFEYPLLIAVVVGITTVIPLIGAYLGCFIGAFLLLISMGPWPTFIFIILFIVIQQIENNLIYPHVVGTSVGLPPLWILVAVMLGGGLGGLLGMIFFIPLFSVIYAKIQADARRRLAAKGIPSPVRALPAKKPRLKHFAFGRRRTRTDEAGGAPNEAEGDAANAAASAGGERLVGRPAGEAETRKSAVFESTAGASEKSEEKCGENARK